MDRGAISFSNYILYRLNLVLHLLSPPILLSVLIKHKIENSVCIKKKMKTVCGEQ